MTGSIITIKETVKPTEKQPTYQILDKVIVPHWPIRVERDPVSVTNYLIRDVNTHELKLIHPGEINRFDKIQLSV